MSDYQENQPLKSAQKRYRQKPEVREKRKAYDKKRGGRAEYQRLRRLKKKLEGEPPV